MQKSQRAVLGIVIAAFALAAFTAGMVNWWSLKYGPEVPADDRDHPAATPAIADAAHAHEGGHAALADVNDPAQVLNLPANEAPGVKVTMLPAADGGWDMRLALSNFRFAPANAGDQHIAGMGHAHLFVDGNYLEQVDAPQHHLAALPVGVHEVTVGLNALDHRAFASDRTLVAERIMVKSTSRRPATLPTEVKTIELRLAGNRLGTGSNTERVKVGELVQLRWKSDAASSLHLHGYDIEADLSPASPVSMLFLADAAGRFPVEVHAAAGGAEQTVFYLEVYP